MKNIYLLVLLFISLFVNAQVKDLGGTPVKGIIPIKRTDLNSNKTLNKAQIEQNQLLDPGVPTGNSTEVGVTQGQLSVSLTGGANYSIPIAVPPGIAGAEPQIGLAYNSQGGNGLAGFGWNITGLSVITRVPSTKYHDNAIDAVDFDNLDRYALDGQRLMMARIGEIYGANLTVYETENFSNLKITSNGVSPYGANFGPESFVVEYPDGSKAYYGITTNSRSKTEWAITYWENLQGVRISYVYNNSNNTLSISKVLYGALGASTHINEVQFVYNSRERAEESFVGGESFIMNSILKEIKVVGNGVGFRNYLLGHNATTLGYERLINVTEKSGDNTKSLNPTVFTYEDSEGSNTFFSLNTTSVGMSNVRNTNAANINGDFDGDGKIDMILYPISSPYGDWINPDAKKKYWLYTDINGDAPNIAYEHPVGTFDEIFPVSWITGSASFGYKLSHTQGWNVVKLNGNVTTFTTYSAGGVMNPINLQDQKSYQFPKFTYGYWRVSCGLRNSSSNKTEDPIDPTDPVWVEVVKDFPKIYLNGDFNGDAITDLVVVEGPVSYEVTQNCNTFTATHTSGTAYFVDLDKRLSSNYVNYAGGLSTTVNSKFFVCDVNGDGKSDILVINQGVVHVYTMNDAKQLVLLFSKNDSGIKTDKQILIGDYNGDGKSDFVVPQELDVDNWSFYFSNGISSFTVKTTGIGLPYFAPICDNTVKNTEIYHMANDFNGDGKTDIFQFANSVQPDSQCHTNHDGDPFFSVFRLAENKISGINQIAFNVRVEGGIHDLYSGDISVYGIRRFPVLSLLDYKNQNNNLEFSLIIVDKIHTFTYNKDNKKDTRLKEITLGNGVKEGITYSPLEPEANSFSATYNDSRGTENYPNVDIVVAPTFQVVSKIENRSQTDYKKQEFRYFGAVSNVEGLGFLGFRCSSKTNWFNDAFAPISSLTKFDITKRGAISESYTFKGDYILSSNFNTNSFISKSVFSYDGALLQNYVYKIKNTSSVIYNGLEGTSKESVTTSYDNYNNPLSNTVYTKLGTNIQKTDITSIVYFNDLGTPYIIGRPTKKNTTSYGVNGVNQMDAEEIYSYTNSLLTRVKRKGHNTDYIIEDNEYDNFGNIKKKTISASGLTPRITSYVYDPSGRFLTKAVDIESLATDYTYDFNNGLLKTETKPGNITTTYNYDVWGKKKEIKDYLSKKVTIDYSVSSSGYSYITTTGEDNSYQKSEYDDLGRLIKDSEKNIDDTHSTVNTQYDIYNRKISVSTPYNGLSGNPTSYTTSSFDEYGRLSQTVEHTGKITNIDYDGLTTTVSDGIKTEIIVKDAVGNVVSKTDNGGTITYQYYINGNLKQSYYNGTTIDIEQDGWGRKKKLTDPAAGVYDYEYNILGELTKEITPNGTTYYNLDRYGRLESKSIQGVNTNYNIFYAYVNGLLVMEDGTDNNYGLPFTLEYFYDSYNRLITKYESNDKSFFEVHYEYDAFGRVLTEKFIANNLQGGQSSTKKIRNTYKNGHHWQILDDVTSQMLWQTNSVNSRGQLTGASYGNGIAITNSYDQYGFPTQLKHDKIGTPSVNIMTLNTVFEPLRGNLTSRSSNLFNLNETFEYDNLDRLVKWSIPSVVTDNNAFVSGVDGFVAIAPSTVSNFSGQLKVAATGIAGTKKAIVPQAIEGEKISVSLYVGIGNTPNIRVDIIETNSVTGATQLFNKLMINRNGTRTFDHTVSQNSSIEIEINESFVEVEDTTSSYFYVDNFVVTKYPLEKQDYDDRGRITANNLGTYNYNKTNSTGLPIHYQNSSINPTPDALAYYTAKPLQTVTYNVFKAPVKIEQPGIDIINFWYNAASGRSSMFYGGLQSNMLARPLRKHYSADGSMEIKHNTQTGAVEFITYIGGDGYSAPVVFKNNGTTQEYLYLHRDYQGTIVAITNQTGNIVEKRHFNAWGAIVKVQDGAGNNLTGLTVLDRGYTGHEHVQSVGLIHMNGRLYDPKLHRFLQPDNYVQDPYNTQNFNRYGYVMNNPTKFTDPSGEYFGLDDAIAAVVGGVINLGVNIYQGNIHNFGQGLAAFGAGAAAGWLALYPEFGGWAAGGAIVGATNSWLSGGDPIEGAVMGGISSVVGGYAGKYAAGALGGVVVNGIKVTSPLLQGTIVGSLVGAFTSGVTGFSMALASGASFDNAIGVGIDGMRLGFVTGGIAGAAGAYSAAKKGGYNLFTGKAKAGEVLIGGPQSKVDQVASKMQVETINSNKISNWPKDLFPYQGRDLINPAALEFNQNWINDVIKSNYRIYDLGRNGYSPFYNGIEINTINTMNYQNVYQTRTFFNNNVIINYRF
ncbi:hypothetical protein FLJC2902T_22670 [Flavobacterium limnosediminis JC2902]|uniref:Teneurin-like YD-shell domain-containing protein n=1 Tax=Flavobacterium limnosediminis JC2902 TaxID=1341181 RepID=V6SKW5_9FLAO|nr:RHS repeat-associated core domain-containing protein [Flavobacterium limnosediminis]ESU27089.1 hypothetical protein FLJC2902T_22670 [Flavobacterium limnosediminis JC2902]